MNRTTTANGPAAPAVETQARPSQIPRTKYPEIFGMLAREFRPEHIKVRTQAGRQMQYITARTVMNRLDFALGPENWWDKYTADEHSVYCELTIRLPDGQVLTKCDAGGYAGMQDPGDDDKSGYADAFKRAAVKFGVGRHLYNDGVVSYPKADTSPRPLPADAPASHPELAAATPDTSPEPAPQPTGSLNFIGKDWVQSLINEYEGDWAAFCVKEGKPHKKLVENIWQAINGVVSQWVEDDPREAEFVETKGVRKKGKVAVRVGQAFESDRHETEEDFRRYLDDKWAREAQKLGVNLDSEPKEEALSNA